MRFSFLALVLVSTAVSVPRPAEAGLRELGLACVNAVLAQFQPRQPVETPPPAPTEYVAVPVEPHNILPPMKPESGDYAGEWFYWTLHHARFSGANPFQSAPHAAQEPIEAVFARGVKQHTKEIFRTKYAARLWNDDSDCVRITATHPDGTESILLAYRTIDEDPGFRAHGTPDTRPTHYELFISRGANQYTHHRIIAGTAHPVRTLDQETALTEATKIIDNAVRDRRLYRLNYASQLVSIFP